MATAVRDKDMECGIGNCRPRVLQKCTNITSFVGVYCVSSLLTHSCVTYLSSQITTLERYFGFTSSQSGFLLACNDIGFLMFTLFVSHQAKKSHIPRVLGCCSIVFGTAAIISTMTYFASLGVQKTGTNDGDDKLLLGNGSVKIDPMAMILAMRSGQLCKETFDDCDSPDALKHMPTKIGTPTSFTPVALAILAISLIFQGIGKSPRQAFLTCYIDDNGDKRKTSLFIGILTGVSILGPAISYGLGGVFATTYVTLEDVDISPMDPRWVGAWWLGFIIFGSFAILSGIPILFFPKYLKPQPVWMEHTNKSTMKSAVIDFLKASLELTTNKVYVLITIAGIIQVFAISGFFAFTPKYLETQFFLPAWKANVLMGMLAVLSAGLGSALGGFMVYKFKMSPMTCLKCLMVVTAISLLFACTIFFIGCDNPEIIGYNASPSSSDNSSYGCYDNCMCDKNDYFPVCGSDGRNYFSPCYAGCNNKTGLLYNDCACLGSNGTVTPGLCPTDCKMLPVAMAVAFVASLIGTFAIMPGYIFYLRSVRDDQKGLAIGMTAFLQSVLGWLPGPVVFGKMVDTFCEVWSSSCNGRGACAKYDIVAFRYGRATYEVLIVIISILLQTIVYFIARNKTDWSTGEPKTEIESNVYLQEKQRMIELDLPVQKPNNVALKWTADDYINNTPRIMKTFKGSMKK